MRPDQWERVKSIVIAVQSSPPQGGDQLIEQMAAGDEEVVAEVKSLLQNATHAAAPMSEALPANFVVNNRYRIERVLGRGGFATTYLARDTSLDQRRVAMKILDRAGSDELLDQSFEVELKSLARLDHPGVVQPLDSGRLSDGRRFIVIQFIEGYSLRSAMEHGAMPSGRVAALLQKIGSAMYAVHKQGISHRDLKPENIMVQLLPDGAEQPRIIDFGIARTLSASQTSAFTMHVMGTLRYMAPEQLEGRISRSTDIYSLAVLTYEMLTGVPPFPADTHIELLRLQLAGPPPARTHCPAISAEVDGILRQALAMDPAKRPQDIAVFAESMAAALVKPVEARSTRRVWVAGICGVCTAAAGGVWLVRQRPKRQPPPPDPPAAAAERRLTLTVVPTGEGASSRWNAAADAYQIQGPFRLKVAAVEECNLYLFAESGESLNILFPSPNSNSGSSRVASGEMLGQQLEFDEQSKRTKLWIVWSRSAVGPLEDAKRWLNPRDGGAITDKEARARVQSVLRQGTGEFDPASGEVRALRSAGLLVAGVWMIPASQI